MAAWRPHGVDSSSLPGSERILLAFSSTWVDHAVQFVQALRAVRPDLEIWVVAEYPPPAGCGQIAWIPWFPGRTLGQNLGRIRAALRGKKVEWAGLVLDRQIPFWPMRAAAVFCAGPRLLLFNESMDHFSLRPADWPQAARHLRHRLRDFTRHQTNPGGWLYTQVWRLGHPRAYVRPLLVWAASGVGLAVALGKRPGRAAAPLNQKEPPEGVTVVVPSRHGRALLERLLPGLKREMAGLEGEILVVDNGSGDGTAEWLGRRHPDVLVESSREALSFASAVNRGIRRARYRRILLLNNDMELEPGFFAPLLRAFRETPGLFCAAAQIFFPEGKRREETGKTAFRGNRERAEFPVFCPEPVDGEDLSWVLYGSGGCSMYDTRKLRALGGMDEDYRPAYVEDLDLGFRAWRMGWPTVFVSGARAVHHHRATTSRFFQPDEIQAHVEINYLKFLVKSVGGARLFRRLWRQALDRLNWHAAQEPPREWACWALRSACRACRWAGALPPAAISEEAILALGSGEAARFPGVRRDGRKPVVLILSAYLPWPLSHGGAVRMFNLMKHAAAGFDQVLIAFCDHHERPAREVLDLCAEVILVRRKGSHLRPMTERPEVVEEHDQPAFRAALQAALRHYEPALVQMEFTQMGLYASDCGDIPSVLVEHDITLDLYRQLARTRDDWETRQQLKRWERFERRLWRQVSCVVTMSQKDAAMVEGARRVEVLENGVDLERFVPSAEGAQKGRILFIGSFAHLPNLLGLDFFLREAWPRLRAAGALLHVISGSNPRHYLELYKDRVQIGLPAEGVEWDAFVADVRPAYGKAEVVIAPLLASAGTNIKILEAMAMKKAVVATPAGVNGLDVHPGEDVVVVESGREMAEAVLGLMSDAARREAIGAAARRTAQRRYGWGAIGRRQAAMYRSLLEGRQAPGPANAASGRSGR